ncbi:hypothetical protein TKK_0011471 [Trichogramma kaykai]
MIKNYDNGPPYECDSCDDTYEDKKNLTIHKMERSIVRAREQFKTRNSHVCSVCGSAFKTSSELVAHYEYCRSCHQTRAQQLCSVVCEICNRKFKDLKSQKAHKAWSHSIDILCPLCDERLSSPEELLVHQTSVHAKESRPSCKYCGKSFDECLTLEAHVACHEGENGPVSCSYCEKIFRHEHYLKRHVESVHQDPGRMVVLETSNLRENNKEIKMYKCEHCEYETKTRRFFLLHADKHNAPERKECELCGKKLRPKYFNIHMRIHMDDFNSCCSSSSRASARSTKPKAKSSRAPRRTVAERQDQRKYTPSAPRRRRHECRFCSKLYATQSQLALHVRSHTNQSFVCNFCGEPQLSADTLNTHLGRYHREASLSCQICKRFFASQRSLTLHSRCHANEDKRKHVCLVCDKSFSSHAYLKTHAKQHALAPKQLAPKKTYNCADCDFSTVYSSNLQKHVATHTGENKSMCHVCGKWVVRSYMPVHVRIHSSEKPHLCDICGKRFSVLKYLLAHERMHTGDKPYRCQICNKRFSQETPLKMHIKLHQRKLRINNDESDDDDADDDFDDDDS